jgi:hypothetical protein
MGRASARCTATRYDIQTVFLHEVALDGAKGQTSDTRDDLLWTPAGCTWQQQQQQQRLLHQDGELAAHVSAVKQERCCCLLLCRIAQELVGGPAAFEPFMADYLQAFAFKTVDSSSTCYIAAKQFAVT